MQVAMAGAMAAVPASILALIQAYGWRGAFVALAVILAGGLLPLVTFVYRQSPRDVGQFADGNRSPPTHHRSQVADGMTLAAAMRQRAYWIMLLAAAMWALVGTGMIFHLEALFAVHGFGQQESARALAYLALSMATRQIGGGLWADRLAMRWLVVTALGAIALSSGLLAAGRPTWLEASYALFGCGQGMMTIVAGTAWARYFGRAHLGAIRGTSLTAAVGASAIGPLAMGMSVDYFGSFAPSLWLFAAVSTAIAIAGCWATPPRHLETGP